MKIVLKIALFINQSNPYTKYRIKNKKLGSETKIKIFLMRIKIIFHH